MLPDFASSFFRLNNTMTFFSFYLLALFCLFVKNIVENDSFFFFNGYFIVSTFYTLIYKLCNFAFLVIRMPVRLTYLIIC